MKNKITPPEFWRFIFIIFICLLHFEEDVNNRVHILASAGYLGVDFFFLLAGFCLALSQINKPSGSPFVYLSKKVKQIYPAFLISVFLMIFTYIIIDHPGVKEIASHIFDGRFQYFFLNAYFPCNLEMRSLWFLSNYFVSIFLVYYLIMFYRNFFHIIFVPFLCLPLIMYLVMQNGCLFRNPTEFIVLWQPSFLKPIAEVSIGAFLYKIFMLIKDVKLTVLGKTILTVIELINVSYILAVIVLDGRDLSDFNVFFGFCFLIITSFYNKSYLSRLLNNKLSNYLGSISIVIYLSHLIVVHLFDVVYSGISDKMIYVYFVTSTIIFAICVKTVEPYFKRFISVISKMIVCTTK